MPKFIKFGRFAIAYDDRPRQTKPGPTPPPPSPSPPEERNVHSRWATFGKIMALILGLIVALIIVESTRPAENVDPAATTQAATDPNSPQVVCERQDVQELASKEARKIMLDPSRKKILMLALFGLADPKEVMQRLDNASVTFSNVHGITSAQNLISCSAAMRIDDSDANLGQDIVQAPMLAWTVKFADGNGDLTSTNFTVDVEPSSAFDGLQINGKPAEDFFKGGSDSDAVAQASPADATDPAQEDVKAAGDAADRAASEAGKQM